MWMHGEHGLLILRHRLLVMPGYVEESRNLQHIGYKLDIGVAAVVGKRLQECYNSTAGKTQPVKSDKPVSDEQNGSKEECFVDPKGDLGFKCGHAVFRFCQRKAHD